MASRSERALQAATESRVSKRYDASIQLPGHAVRSKFALHVPEGDLRAGKLMLHMPELWVGPSDHVGVSGRNGVGKTTPLRSVRKLVPEQVECAFIPQEVDERSRQAALERLRALDDADKGRVLSLVAGLNTDPDALREGSKHQPRDGRNRSLPSSCCMSRTGSSDEPTNHLDVGSIEALERALAAFLARTS